MAGGLSKRQPQTGYAARNPEYAGQYADTPDYGTPNSAYAAPDLRRDAPYTDEFGWGPKTRISVETTPDAMREMEFPVRGDGPYDGTAPKKYWGPRDADEAQRESVTNTDANGWTTPSYAKRVNRNNPRETPPAETRWTERLGPSNWSFTRPFDQGAKGTGARFLNGVHFSMADHRRDYPILGMRPMRQSRNTYRVDPAPWDADMYDVPPESTIGVSTQARYQAVESMEIPGSTRSYRL
jgi:hypothetical protein